MLLSQTFIRVTCFGESTVLQSVMASAERSTTDESKGYGGYDECFLETTPERLVCSICTKVMRDPHLMACCGKEFCISCLQSWFNQQNTEECPHCRATKRDYNVLHILDKGVKSEIESQFILCTNYKEGCEWVGELRNQASHTLQCDFVKTHCPNGCDGSLTTLLLRKDVSIHLKNHCELREKRCQHCGHVGTVKSYPSHEKICEVLHPRKRKKSCIIS